MGKKKPTSQVCEGFIVSTGRQSINVLREISRWHKWQGFWNAVLRSHNMDAEHLTGLKTFFVTKLPRENTWQPTSGGYMIAICIRRIHERFRKEWFEILDTRELNSFHLNHSPCGVQHLFLGLFFPLRQQFKFIYLSFLSVNLNILFFFKKRKTFCGQSNLNIQWPLATHPIKEKSRIHVDVRYSENISVIWFLLFNRASQSWFRWNHPKKP
jgi:hypothetical protein